MTGGASVPGGESKRAALSRELSEFLIELSIALHKHAMYPPDHPSLAPAAGGVVRRAEHLLADRPSISLGVARNQLVIEGVATDSRHPVLSDLARRLHKHHLGAVSFYKGLEEAELVDLLHTLAAESDRDGREPLGLGPSGNLQRWHHARLHPLAYERLELLDEEGADDESAGADSEGAKRVRGAQFWIGLARAAMAGQVADDEAPPTQPAIVARAIDEHPGSAAYDQVIVGYLLQIAEELRAAGGEGAVELRRKTAALVRALRPETLQRLVRMGGDGTQRARFVRDAADGMAVDAVVEILKAAAEVSQQQISHSLVRLLSKLATHAERGVVRSRPVADRGLRDQVRTLLSGWELKDPNPGSYGMALERIAMALPSETASRTVETGPDLLRLVEISLEVKTSGPRVALAIESIIASGGLDALLNCVENGPPSAALDALRTRLASPDVVTRFLTAEPLDLPLLDRVIALSGIAAAVPLLDALAVAESRSTRRHLVNRLIAMGETITPDLIARLSDSRWYVVRNLLSVLDTLPALPPEFDVNSFTSYPDPRVRRLALKMQIAVPGARERGLATALNDADPEIVMLGLLGLGNEIPRSLEQRVEQLATDGAASPETREHAIRTLGYCRSEGALAALLAFVDGGRTFFGKQRLAPKSPEMLAALRALASGWSSRPAASRVLERASFSSDAAIRAAASMAGER